MEDRTAARWYWVVTICNVVATVLLALLIYSALIMLALFTSPTSMLPFYLLPATVLFLSVVGFVLVRKRTRRLGRWIGYSVHTAGLLLSFLLLTYLGFLWSGLGSGKETYLIPEGYQGEVCVIYWVTPNGMGSAAPKSAIYTIPRDGVLVVSHPEIKSWSGWTKTRYYYLAGNGMRREITEHWDSTIPDTPENLSNTSDVGIFFPTTGEFSNTSGCRFRMSQFYVGTKAHLLRDYKPIDLGSYLREYNICVSHPAG